MQQIQNNKSDRWSLSNDETSLSIYADNVAAIRRRVGARQLYRESVNIDDGPLTRPAVVRSSLSQSISHRAIDDEAPFCLAAACFRRRPVPAAAVSDQPPNAAPPRPSLRRLARLLSVGPSRRRRRRRAIVDRRRRRRRSVRPRQNELLIIHHPNCIVNNNENTTPSVRIYDAFVSSVCRINPVRCPFDMRQRYTFAIVCPITLLVTCSREFASAHFALALETFTY